MSSVERTAPHHRSAAELAIAAEILSSGRGGAWLAEGFTWLTQAIALGSVLLLGWIAWVIFQKAQPAIQQYGLGFLASTDWDPANLQFGALVYIYGSLVTAAIALVIAIPVGLAVALITSETILPAWVRSPIGFLVELIASIPSVIIGFWGIFVFVPLFQPVQVWLHQQFGWLPLLGTDPAGPSTLIAGIILAIMILPTIAAIVRDVLRAIPQDLRTASMALGATRWETIFSILLPASVSGILGAVMLALGRALGETMAVTMVIGNSDTIKASLIAPGNTIPALLANQFPEALDDLHIGALMYLALILFILTLLVNLSAVWLVQALTKRS
jgi:phosphate transport system permease protein